MVQDGWVQVGRSIGGDHLGSYLIVRAADMKQKRLDGLRIICCHGRSRECHSCQGRFFDERVEILEGAEDRLDCHVLDVKVPR